MDDSMNDELEKIIAAQDKVALDEYADVRGINLDRRKSFANMLTEFEEALTAPDEPAVADEPEPDDAELDELMGDEPVLEVMASNGPEIEATGTIIKGDAEMLAAQNALVSAHTPAPIEPDADLPAQARAWAEGFANNIIRVDADIDGSLMTVHVFTRHGDRRETVPIASASKSDIKAAFAWLSVVFGVA